jgi:hypothetical protein
MFEFPGADLVGEQNIEFGKREPASLGKSEVDPKRAKDIASEPEPRAFRSPAPTCWLLIQHVWKKLIEWDGRDHVKGPAHGDGLRSQVSSGDFAGNGVTQGIDVGLKPEGLDDKHGSLSIKVGGRLLDKREDALLISAALESTEETYQDDQSSSERYQSGQEE